MPRAWATSPGNGIDLVGVWIRDGRPNEQHPPTGEVVLLLGGHRAVLHSCSACLRPRRFDHAPAAGDHRISQPGTGSRHDRADPRARAWGARPQHGHSVWRCWHRC